jgi:hypothetical protein
MITPWPFPWPQPRPGMWDTDGPRETTIVHLVGADYLVEPTGDTGIHSSRDRFRVTCSTCDELLHSNTTGPSSRIEDHHRWAHGPKKGPPPDAA